MDIQGGQNQVIYLVSDVQLISNKGLDFVFTDGHARMKISKFFDDLASLPAVDWNIMKNNYWYDTDDDGDRKRRRQAEFLVHNFFPLALVKEIYVINSVVEAQVQADLSSQGCSINTFIRKEWYY